MSLLELIFLLAVFVYAPCYICWLRGRIKHDLENVVSVKLKELTPIEKTYTEYTGFSINSHGGISEHFRRKRVVEGFQAEFYVEYSDKKPRRVVADVGSDKYNELVKYLTESDK